ncbi:hypothetical protein BJV74DRAFT_880935 [Russula compacta]|nr:hypothetical protein BJV74DRAFT_880935 [Russula compacta]
MSSLALGTAFAAVQLVHQAHTKVKTNKTRCARLVERCQLVVDKLKRVAATGDSDAIIRERIHELERAFEYTAQTIAQVGQQSIIASLMQSENNALRIESCNEALTELISLFNLEEIVDVRRWQTDLEIARVRDHRELLSMGQRIESGNAAISRELAQQGSTIAEVLRVIRNVDAGLQNASLARETLNKIATLLPSRNTTSSASRRWRPEPTTAAATNTALPTAKVMTGSGTPEASALYTACASAPKSTGSKSKAATVRRLLFTKKCMVVPPRADVFSELSFPPPLPPRGAPAETPCSGSPIVSRLISVSGAAAGDDDTNGGLIQASSYCPLSVDPLPPYRLRVLNTVPSEHECLEDGTPAMSSSRLTTTSIEAVRALDSPVPTFPSPKLSTESVFGSTQTLASVSSGSGTSPGLRCTRRHSATGARPVLRRRETIRFARRMTTLSSGYPSVQPIIQPLQRL